MSTAEIEQLARWRVLGARNSEQVVRLAPKVLAAETSGETEWAVREQLAIAALDLGKVSLANTQIRALQNRFPKSPRVDLLAGLRLEALGESDRAQGVYRALLKHDETNISAHQRLVALAPTRTSMITRLLEYLDTFYVDASAWSLLAELYADEGAYGQSLTALGHVMVLQTWDSHTVTRAGETAFTMGDYQLALKYFLRASEMETPPDAAPGGRRTRTWWGIKRCAQRLLESSHPTSMDGAPSTPEQLRKLDALATERILAIGGANLSVSRAVLAAV